MSVQLGRWNTDGRPIEPDYAERLKPMLAPYGPDQEGFYRSGEIAMLHCAFLTSKESRCERQPHITRSGAVICWDGRVDNREELIRQLGDRVKSSSPDLLLVAEAYEQWGSGCFGKLVGDWALSIWDATRPSLFLAIDPIGTRRLYYSPERDSFTWSSILDPLVLSAENSLALSEEYVAGWLTFYPASHLTPYSGIYAVPPSCFVRIEPGKHRVAKYWDFDGSKRIRYKSDFEYEEHFRSVFSMAIRSRLRSDGPVLAELSGGVDSSSIVCVADSLIAHGEARPPRLDTVSYYNESEPNWNERPYFTRVEQQRGRAGHHIDLSSEKAYVLEPDDCRFRVAPAASRQQNRATREFAELFAEGGYRVLLSGFGGDEFNGGVPTPVPELQDLFARARLGTFALQLKAWALEKRQPGVHLLGEVLRGFLPSRIAGVPTHKKIPVWLDPDFIRRNRVALVGYPHRFSLGGSLPSFQENLASLETLRRQLASQIRSCDPLCEKRYPYLDRALLEYLFAIPREQLVRPRQRRSLMRRALRGIVPPEILDRKRKAYVSRNSIIFLEQAWQAHINRPEAAKTISLGIFAPDRLAASVEAATHGLETRIAPIIRALILESWLADLGKRNILCPPRANPFEASRVSSCQSAIGATK